MFEPCARRTPARAATVNECTVQATIPWNFGVIVQAPGMQREGRLVTESAMATTHRSNHDGSWSQRVAAIRSETMIAAAVKVWVAIAVCASACASGCAVDENAPLDPPPVVSFDPGAPSGRALWVHAGEDTRGAGGRAVHVDADGNVVTLGDFIGRIDFGGASVHGNNYVHPFVVRHAADGSLLSTVGIVSPSWADATDMALDADGNAYVVGRFVGAIDLVTPPLHSFGAHDAFVVKLDRAGDALWAKTLAKPGSGWNVADAFGVAVDGKGNVVVAGAFKGALDFGGNHVLQGSDSPYFTQGFVAEFDSQGTCAWARQFGTVAYASSVAFDSRGNAVVTGAFVGNVSLGGMNGKSDGQGDLFVAELDARGHAVWLDAFSAPGHADGWDVCVAPDDAVVYVGEYDTPIDFGGGPTPGRNGGFVARFDSTGALQWNRSFVDPSGDKASVASVHGVACGKDGSIAITSVFQGPFACGSGDEQSVDGGVGLFVASLAPDGSTRWTRPFADAAPNNVDGAVAFGPGGELFVTGKFENTLDLGDDVAARYDREDAFVARFAP